MFAGLEEVQSILFAGGRPEAPDSIASKVRVDVPDEGLAGDAMTSVAGSIVADPYHEAEAY